jgi:hypothetical protein
LLHSYANDRANVFATPHEDMVRQPKTLKNFYAWANPVVDKGLAHAASIPSNSRIDDFFRNCVLFALLMLMTDHNPTLDVE